MSETVTLTLKIPKDLYDRALRFVEENKNAFNTLDELIVFLLKEAVSEREMEEFTPEEEKELEKRLRDLGYI